jgi:hypothetical protein
MSELMALAFDATFVAVVVKGHILLVAALIRCPGDDPAGGRRTAAADPAHRRLVTRRSPPLPVLALEAVT